MPTQPILAPEQLADLGFPLRGVDLSQPFGQQLPQTTPLGINVRAYEALTQRGRGGSRPGLVEFIPQQLPLDYVSGSHLIQHLNIIVDPDATALLDSGPSPSGDVVDDPSSVGAASSWPPGGSSRNPGRKVRRGGSGKQPTKNRSQMALVQGDETNEVADSGVVIPFDFPKAVTKGNLLIVAVTGGVSGFSDVSGHVTNDVTVTVNDSQGNTYTQIAGDLRMDFTHDDMGILIRSYGISLSVWYAIAGSSGPCTVQIVRTTSNDGDFGSQVSGDLTILEVSSPDPLSPLDASSTNTVAPPNSGTLAVSTGSIGVSTSEGEFLVGFFLVNGSLGPTPVAGESVLGGQCFYKPGVKASQAITGTADFFGGSSHHEFGYLALGASFKKA